jgi:polysaccharide pyruvyl transferase WcaK-like protein
MMENKQKIAEVKGIAFPNRGAELLLMACLEQLISRKYLIATEPYSPYHYKVAYPLYTKTRIDRFGINLIYPFSLLPKYIRERLGLVKGSELSLILDASGYAYGDPWPVSLAKQRLLNEKLSCPKIMLPQSFGPFTSRKNIDIAKRLADKCSLIYAREEEGASNFEKVTGRQISVIPDITFLLSSDTGQACRDIVIVPNFQVYKRNGDLYLDCLKKVIKELVNNRRMVTILNHEGEKDRKISSEIIEGMGVIGSQVEYLEPSSGNEAKGIISTAKFILTSRYHALISALASAVPCMALGWSFKYEEALKNFDIDSANLIGSPEKIVEIIESESYCQQFGSNSYVRKRTEIENKVSGMWQEIFTLIDS